MGPFKEEFWVIQLDWVKPITRLTLIASTARVRPVPPLDFWDSESLQKGWELCRTNVVFRKNVLDTLKPLPSWVDEQKFPHGSEAKQLFKDVSKCVEAPY